MRKFCFKCNREHNEQDMVPKYNKWGKKIGTECRLCAKRQSHSFMSAGNQPKPENQKPIVIE
jgi:hypothetical protein